jgi:threonylcarbamoyladenosine tRNA methylthiotransferase MtaB
LAEDGSHTRAFVKVQDGCNNRCSFCIVTVARGAERSRPLGDVVAEIQRLRAEGFQEAVLTGVHLGGYGNDLGVGLTDLVSAILGQTDLPRLRLSSLEPWDLAPQFFELWAASGGRLCPHLHLPLQAGCDRTLQRMARRTRTADFRHLVAAARQRIPDLVLTTDVIAGFPGETAADFAESLAFVEALGFAHVHVFPYSARTGTAASRFEGQVPPEERRRRVAAMEAVARRTGDAVRQRFVGAVRPVLWEQWEAGTGWSGLTDNYLRVQTAAPSGTDLANRITPARLVSLDSGILQASFISGL